MKRGESKTSFNTLSIEWKSAVGAKIFCEDGREFIDFTSGMFVTNSGHSNPEIKKAITRSLEHNLIFSYNYKTKIRTEFEQDFLELVGPRFSRYYHFSCGTEATSTAFLAMKQLGALRQKKDIYFFKGNYHGRGVFGELFKESDIIPKPDYIKHLDFPYDANIKFHPNMIPNPHEVAGIFIETYQGWGAWMYPVPYLRDLLAFCKLHNILVCFDEIQAGFFRMGALFGFDTYFPDIEPDFVCLSKGLSSSLPHAILLVGKNVKEELYINHQGTYSSSPIILAASLANIRELKRISEENDFYKKIDIFETFCADLAKMGNVKCNYKGFVAGIIFDKKETADHFVNICLADGIHVVCTNRESVKISPPLVISIEDMTYAFQVMIRNIKKLTDGHE